VLVSQGSRPDIPAAFLPVAEDFLLQLGPYECLDEEGAVGGVLKVGGVVVGEVVEEGFGAVQVRAFAGCFARPAEILLAPYANFVAQRVQLFNQRLFVGFVHHRGLGRYPVGAHALPLELLPQRVALPRDLVEALHQVVLAAPRPHVWSRRAFWRYHGAPVHAAPVRRALGRCLGARLGGRCGDFHVRRDVLCFPPAPPR
jgi:hypothetical protein